MLKRAGLIVTITAWETYVEDRLREKVGALATVIKGSHLSKLIESKLESELAKFNTPNAANTKKLFLDYCDVDVTTSWTKWGGNAKDAQDHLNNLIKLRGSAAHRSSPVPTTLPAPAKRGPKTHLVSLSDLSSAVGFIKSIAETTDLPL